MKNLSKYPASKAQQVSQLEEEKQELQDATVMNAETLASLKALGRRELAEIQSLSAPPPALVTALGAVKWMLLELELGNGGGGKWTQMNRNWEAVRDFYGVAPSEDGSTFMTQVNLP